MDTAVSSKSGSMEQEGEIGSSEGTTENSPAVHCRVQGGSGQVPKGRLKNGCQEFGRPVGTCAVASRFPALKLRAILGCPSGTHGGVAGFLTGCRLAIKIMTAKERMEHE